MVTRLTQLHDAPAHVHTELVLHDIHIIAERAPIVRTRSAA